jgi:molybdenum cofactor cytidylyltransferase
MNIGIIILAAGSSSRMGTSKQLLHVDGEPLLQKAINSSQQTNAQFVVVVLGADAKVHRHAIKDLNINVVENREWENGMGSSLKAGLRYVKSSQPSTDAIVIMVCDQPEVTAKHLNELVRVYCESKKAIVASYYAGAPGVPALIDKSLFAEVMAIEDSFGAKKVIQQHPDKTELVEFNAGAIDIDTPEEYQNYLRRK